MGVLIAVGIPTFGRAVEQSRADLAAANLRAVWSAERLYWLENNTYTTDLSALQALGLLDPTVVTAATVYVYQVPSADAASFTATATRTGSRQWTGTLSMDQSGTLSGSIQASGQPTIVPAFQ
jgi:type II secretory pathway pseudopilin PulG